MNASHRGPEGLNQNAELFTVNPPQLQWKPNISKPNVSTSGSRVLLCVQCYWNSAKSKESILVLYWDCLHLAGYFNASKKTPCQHVSHLEHKQLCRDVYLNARTPAHTHNIFNTFAEGQNSGGRERGRLRAQPGLVRLCTHRWVEVLDMNATVWGVIRARRLWNIRAAPSPTSTP